MLSNIVYLIRKLTEVFQSGNPVKIAVAIGALILAAITSFWF